MSDLERCLESPAVQEWLDRLCGTTFAHGGALVMLVPGADNVARAEKFLELLETGGYIIRGRRLPTREQNFFGVGGASGAAMSSSVIFGYSPGPRKTKLLRI